MTLVQRRAGRHLRARPPGRWAKRAIGLGAVLVFGTLISVPLIPAIGGIPDAVLEYPIMPELPDRAGGAYLEVNGAESGYLKLFAWSTAPADVPAETPVIDGADLGSLTVIQKALDDPAKYLLYRVDSQEIVDTEAVVAADGRRLDLVPTSVLEPGAYLVDIPIGGMFAGRESYFFVIE